jgi:hypothetical protein
MKDRFSGKRKGLLFDEICGREGWNGSDHILLPWGEAS